MPAVLDVKIKDHFGGTVTFGNYTVLVDTSVANAVYIGKAQVGNDTLSGRSSPVWQIKKIESTSSGIKVLWADGNDLFDNVWDNRTTYTYV